MISLRSFGFLAPKHFKIIWLSNILALSIYNEGYFRNEQNIPAAGLLIQ
jgi:hypothetical protein